MKVPLKPAAISLQIIFVLSQKIREMLDEVYGAQSEKQRYFIERKKCIFFNHGPISYQTSISVFILDLSARVIKLMECHQVCLVRKIIFK